MKPFKQQRCDAPHCRLRIRTFVIGAALLLVFAGATRAQEARGTITGTVRDASSSSTGATS